MSAEQFPEPVIEDHPLVHLALIRKTLGFDEIRAFYDASFLQLFAALQDSGRRLVGAPLGITYGTPGHLIDLAVALPLDAPLGSVQPVVGAILPAARTATLVVQGDYEQLAAAHAHLRQWVLEQGLNPAEVAWEQYLTQPEPDADPAQNLTKIGLVLAG